MRVLRGRGIEPGAAPVCCAAPVGAPVLGVTSSPPTGPRAARRARPRDGTATTGSSSRSAVLSLIAEAAERRPCCAWSTTRTGSTGDGRRAVFVARRLRPSRRHALRRPRGRRARLEAPGLAELRSAGSTPRRPDAIVGREGGALAPDVSAAADRGHRGNPLALIECRFHAHRRAAGGRRAAARAASGQLARRARVLERVRRLPPATQRCCSSPPPTRAASRDRARAAARLGAGAEALERPSAPRSSGCAGGARAAPPARALRDLPGGADLAAPRRPQRARDRPRRRVESRPARLAPRRRVRGARAGGGRRARASAAQRAPAAAASPPLRWPTSARPRSPPTSPSARAC